MMNAKNENHLECTLSDTDLFTPPFVQSDIQHGYFENVFPISKLNDHGPVEFIVENSSDKFIDLANANLNLKVQILKGDGKKLDDKDDVDTVNYIFGSIFNQVDVNLGGSIVSTSNNTYSYRAYLETLLNFGRDAKKSQLQMGLYYKDPTGNDGNEYFKKSQVVELCGQLHCDMFHQGRLLLNALPLKITLHRNKSGFMLSTKSNEKYKFVLLEAVLSVRKVQLAPHKFIEIQKSLETSPALYPINRVDVRTHSVAAGLTSLIWDNVFQGQLPNRVFVAMVDNDAFTGSFKKDPFEFKHYNLSKIGCFVNGESLPTQPLKFNFAKDEYLEGYRSLFTTTGKINRDEGIDINRRSYKSNNALFGFDISPSMCNGGHQESVKQGTLRLELEFQEALANTITVLIYADFDNHISIDKFRNVLKNY